MTKRMVTQPGPPGQSMRTMSGFPNQAGLQSRPAPLGSGRLQSNKVGNGPQWAFGVQNGSAPGLGAPQPRGPSGTSSFAQTIGGNQSSSSLDLSEFPSLSGGPQPQYQNLGQAVWSNQRAAQQTPVGRPQPSPGNQIGSGQHPPPAHQGQEHAQQTLDDAFFPSNMNGSLDDYRHGGQGGVGQLSGSGQTQPSTADDFPPLGRLGHGEIGQDRRAAMMQNAAGGPFSGSTVFGSGQASSRAGTDTLRQDSSKNTLQNGRSPFSTDASPQALQDSDGSRSPSAMSEIDRFGLASLLSVLRNQNSDKANLVIGQNLNGLGLELDSSDPLHPSFSGPFATAPARPLQPDYQLPPCYSVGNTHPVEEKLNGLSDETLLWIFYNLPKEVMQEQAAVELTDRNWRYHKTLRCWLTKEQGAPEPSLIGPEVEQGRYVVFNTRAWQREGREMMIRYSDLDDHITNSNRATFVQ